MGAELAAGSVIRRRQLPFADITMAAFLMGPVAAGIVGTLLPALGYLPAIGLETIDFRGFVALASAPGLAMASFKACMIALVSWAISLALAIALVAGLRALPFDRVAGLVSLVLAVPHLALGIGLVFLLGPTGWAVRLPLAALGETTGPAFSFPIDPEGFGLILALVLKETPFLAIMLASSLASHGGLKRLAVARTVGFGPTVGFWLAVVPPLLAHLRLPTVAVIAFGMAPVDLALVLSQPPHAHLSADALRWLLDPSLAAWPKGAAAACWLLLLAILVSAVALGILRAVERRLEGAAALGPPGPPWLHGLAALTGIAVLGLVLALCSLLLLPLWSIAGTWRFPAPWPGTLHVEYWLDHASVFGASAAVTLFLALASAVLAVAIIIVWLELANRGDQPTPTWLTWALLAPLLVPQVAFLFGVQVALVRFGVAGQMAAVLAVHLLFTVPYAFLTLAGPFQSLDPRWSVMARACGHGRWATLLRVKLPLLRPSLALALAVGVAVSVSLYIPTLFAGGGRVSTMALETVALAHGDRRSAAAAGTLLALLPLFAFILAGRVRARSAVA